MKNLLILISFLSCTLAMSQEQGTLPSMQKDQLKRVQSRSTVNHINYNILAKADGKYHIEVVNPEGVLIHSRVLADAVKEGARLDAFVDRDGWSRGTYYVLVKRDGVTTAVDRVLID